MIREATSTDIAKIQEINPFSGSMESEVEDGRLFVIEHLGLVAGFVVESKKGLLGRPYIEYLAVGEQHRRKGLALALISAVESKHQGKKLFISTESVNTVMLRLLKNNGYVHSGTISGANLSGADELYFHKQIT